MPISSAGSSPRLLDRPLWGRHLLWVRAAPNYHPHRAYYRDYVCSARQPNQPTDAHDSVIGEFIDKALDLGRKVYFQTGAAQPRGLRVEDVPRLPDGRLSQGCMANTGSLASEAVRSYNRAYVRDFLEAYPQSTGFRPDWPEYSCRKLNEAFQDFCPAARPSHPSSLPCTGQSW